MWHAKGLAIIASFLGKPLMSDKLTLSRQRMGYARVCVEIYASCEFPSMIPIIIGGKRIEIPVEYPWNPPRCTFCSIFGHSLARCVKKPRDVSPQPNPEVIVPIPEVPKEVWVKKTPKRPRINGHKKEDSIVGTSSTAEEIIMEEVPIVVSGSVKEKVIQFSMGSIPSLGNSSSIVTVPVTTMNKFDVLSDKNGEPVASNILSDSTAKFCFC